MILSKSFILGYILLGVIDICICRFHSPALPGDKSCSVNRTDCLICIINFDVKVDLESIVHESENRLNCDNKILAEDGHYYLPLKLVFSGSELNIYQSTEQYTCTYDDYFGQRCFNPNILVQYIDFSNNNYEEIPDITKLVNLHQLNMSHNQLTAAQLPTLAEFIFLEEIDLSFNSIETIEVLEDEHSYKGLKILNLSHNCLTDIPETVFYNIRNLKYLDLSNNRILNINMLTFFRLNKILRLNLGNNLIESINLSLAKLFTLEELYLQENRIAEVLNADLHSLTQLKQIDLSSNEIRNMESKLFSNMTSLISLNLRNNHLKFVERELFANLSNLSFIDLSHNEITKFPNRMFKEKNITYFSIAENNIEGNLTKGTFEGLRLVKNLDMSYQRITSIDDYAFFGVESITELLLNNNKISRVAKNSFKLLTKLVRLNLSHNHISNITLDAEDFISLEFLSLASNELTYIKKNHLQFLNKLEFLDLSNNNIFTIEANSFKFQAYLVDLVIDKNQLQGNLAEDTFNGLQAVPSLDLSNSSLTIISNGSFDGMTQLNNINISHNVLRELKYNSFINTGHLEILDLSYNQLTLFDLNTTDLTNLRILMLHNNLIKTLSDKVSDFVHLQILDVSYNDVTFLNDKVFSHQNYLEYLDLSHNLNLVIDVAIIKFAEKLKTLHLSSTKTKLNFTWNGSPLSELEMSNSCIQNVSILNLSELKHLSNLVLSNNDVTKLQVGSFTNISSLYSIDMSYNKIMYLQPGLFKGCDNLYIFNISHNSLTNINYGVVRGLSRLSILDISYNLLDRIEDDRFYEMHRLTDLIVDHNKISDVTVGDFLGLNLKKLSIGGNPLPCKTLIRMKKQDYPFVITAITRDDTSEHNYYGVTCIGNNENQIEYYGNNGTRNTDKDMKVLLDIRNILRNLQNNTAQRDERQDTLKTNSLLEGILKVMLAKSSVVTSIQTPRTIIDNTTNVVKYLKHLKDLENNFNNDKERVVSEFDDKILKLSKRIDIAKPDVASQSNSLRNPTFMEVCVALILLILFCSIAFYIYKSKFSFVGNRSLTTRQMTEDIENSHL